VTELIVAGAGMAGLAAAARARELGADPLVLEKSAHIGGSMRLSSGVIWRYASFDEFRSQCPDGDAALQQVVHERLDEDLDWLAGLGAVVTEDSTGNPLTVGRRFDTQSIRDALSREVTISSDMSLGNLSIPETIEGPLQHKNKFGKDYDKNAPNYEPK